MATSRKRKVCVSSGNLGQGDPCDLLLLAFAVGDGPAPYCGDQAIPLRYRLTVDPSPRLPCVWAYHRNAAGVRASGHAIGVKRCPRTRGGGCVAPDEQARRR